VPPRFLLFDLPLRGPVLHDAPELLQAITHYHVSATVGS
jgi:hypothetical protein